MKQPLLGIGDRKGFPGNPAVVAFYVVDVDWKDLQSASGTAILANNPIDRAVAKIRNAPTARGRALKLKPGLNRGAVGDARIPAFVRAAILATGDAATTGAADSATVLMRKKEGANYTEAAVTRWWAAAYMAAYDDLQTGLAAKYDPDAYPEIAEIVVGAATTFYAESFIRQIAGTWSDGSDIGKTNGLRLLRAGYTRTKDQEAIRRSVAAHRAWVNTRSVLSFNYHQWFDTAVTPKASVSDTADVKVGSDPTFAYDMMDMVRRAADGLGPQLGVLGNNDYRYDPTPSPAGAYNKAPQALFTGPRGLFTGRGGLITVQTETAGNLNDSSRPGGAVTLDDVLAGAVTQHVTALELPGVYPYAVGGVRLSDAQLESYNNQIAANYVTPSEHAPTAPTGLAATPDSSYQATLTFSPGTDVDGDLAGAEIWRSVSSGAYAHLANTSAAATSYVDSTLAPSTLYAWKMRSFDAAGNFSAYTAPVSLTTGPVGTDVTPPTVPGSVVATQDESGVAVTHDPSTDTESGVATYRYWRQRTSSPAQAAPGTLMATLPAYTGGAPTPGWHDDDPEYGATSVYGVDATDNAANTSAVGTAPPVTPTDMTPPLFDADAHIDWTTSTGRIDLAAPLANDNVGVDHYLWHRTGGGGGPVDTTVTPTGAQVVLADTAVTDGDVYQYDLTAYDAAGNASTPLTAYVTAGAASAATSLAFGPHHL